MDLRGVILSRLANNKAAARTAILSSAWRYIWRSTPLNLAVDDDLAGNERNRITAVSEILASHRGPVRRLSLETIRLGRNRYARFDGWFRSRVLDGLEELQFYGDGMPPRLLPLRPLPLPPSALRFAPTLHAASIGGCDFPEISALIFPELKRLKLYDVCISEADLRRLLAGCIVLEALELSDIHRFSFSSVQIVSPTLRSIRVSAIWPFRLNGGLQQAFQELVIEDAPCLERLTQVGPLGPNKIKINAAPKLTLLGYLFGNIDKSATTFFYSRSKDIVSIPFTGWFWNPSAPIWMQLSGFLDAFPVWRSCTSSHFLGRSRKVAHTTILLTALICISEK
ncbi:F-box/LRR-repeat protein At4g14103-like [Hordeum vulgare subsp. vulgare]|uniref:F-box/LRR-repeat protein 15/At3g58940/PEG3-like LRR domain-containing protein n=1 Tax=Hordeum vulgare subsp. vulgare TaxID=112509 RepID=A0A8I6XJB5_HORVV|nr:F-box/LRR-repeat protein At4g14103-like [Hordeum vulgare subsp. vulgare]